MEEPLVAVFDDVEGRLIEGCIAGNAFRPRSSPPSGTRVNRSAGTFMSLKGAPRSHQDFHASHPRRAGSLDVGLMSILWPFAVLGIVSGGAYALTGLSIVTVYRATGVSTLRKVRSGWSAPTSLGSLSRRTGLVGTMAGVDLRRRCWGGLRPIGVHTCHSPTSQRR